MPRRPAPIVTSTRFSDSDEYDSAVSLDEPATPVTLPHAMIAVEESDGLKKLGMSISRGMSSVLILGQTAVNREKRKDTTAAQVVPRSDPASGRTQGSSHRRFASLTRLFGRKSLD